MVTTPTDSIERFNLLIPEFTSRQDVSVGKMFGTQGLSVRGKFFAFVASDGALVVKIAEGRIEELKLENMVMRGKPMREWARIPFESGTGHWREAADEAYRFLDEITPR